MEMAYSEGKRPTPRPLVTVRTSDAPLLADGGAAGPEAGADKLHRALPQGGQQRAELVESRRARRPHTAAARAAMGRGREPDARHGAGAG